MKVGDYLSCGKDCYCKQPLHLPLPLPPTFPNKGSATKNTCEARRAPPAGQPHTSQLRLAQWPFPSCVLKTGWWAVIRGSRNAGEAVLPNSTVKFLYTVSS